MTDSTSRPGILTITIKDKSTLYAAYMSFVVNGGLFIPTDRDYEIGQEIFLLLKIIWKTPPRSGNYKSSGIGVQFTDQNGIIVRNKIETYLAGAIASDRPTYTM